MHYHCSPASWPARRHTCRPTRAWSFLSSQYALQFRHAALVMAQGSVGPGPGGNCGGGPVLSLGLVRPCPQGERPSDPNGLIGLEPEGVSAYWLVEAHGVCACPSPGVCVLPVHSAGSSQCGGRVQIGSSSSRAAESCGALLFGVETVASIGPGGTAGICCGVVAAEVGTDGEFCGLCCGVAWADWGWPCVGPGGWAGMRAGKST